MTGSSVHVTDPSGPVHTGAGPQFNGPTFVLDHLQRLVRRGPDPRIVAQAHRDWLQRRFVQPPGYNRALALATQEPDRRRVILIAGPYGSGRRTAATMLLHVVPGGRFQELDAEPQYPDEPALRPDDIEHEDRLLLDLTNSTGASFQSIQAEIVGLRAVVDERNALLAIVLPGLDQLDDQLRPLVCEIDRPDGTVVLARHLEADEIPFAEAAFTESELARLLREAPMRDLAEFARRVRASRDRGGEAAGFADWARSALDGLTHQADEVATQVAAMRSGEDRALLLAAAMLDDAPADAVFEASALLLKAVEHPPEDTPRLERDDLRERLGRAKAEVTPERRVRFAKLAYDQAVRVHFWDFYPALRSTFGTWVAKAVALPMLVDDDRDRLVVRFTEQSLRVGRPQDVVAFVDSCVGRRASGPASPLLPQAALALEMGLGDDRHGIVFRRQLYGWSREYPPRPDLGQLLIQMCTGALAASHPDQALVRLHHLARRDRGDRLGAVAALRNLVASDDRLLWLLLKRFAENLNEHATTQRPDLTVFPRAIDPRWLVRSRPAGQPVIVRWGVLDYLVVSWRAVLLYRDPEDLDSDLADWLAAAAGDGPAATLLEVLVHAAAGRFRPIAVLTAAIRRWERFGDAAAGERAGIARELVDRLESTQGFAVHDRSPMAGEVQL